MMIRLYTAAIILMVLFASCSDKDEDKKSPTQPGTSSQIDLSSSSSDTGNSNPANQDDPIVFTDVEVNLNATFESAFPVFGTVSALEDLVSISAQIQDSEANPVSANAAWVTTASWSLSVVPAILNSANPDLKTIVLHEPTNSSPTDLEMRVDYEWNKICIGTYTLVITATTANHSASTEVDFEVDNALDDTSPLCQ
jgi:hypothetical protein